MVTSGRAPQCLAPAADLERGVSLTSASADLFVERLRSGVHNWPRHPLHCAMSDVANPCVSSMVDVDPMLILDALYYIYVAYFDSIIVIELNTSS